MIKRIVIAFSLVIFATISVASTEVSWTEPVERTDNTKLPYEEIKGYVIHYGRESGSYTNTVSIPRPEDKKDNKHTFTDLENGMNYFVITTIDTGGRESEYSAVVEKNETEGSVILSPTYPDFSMIRVGDTFDYVLTFPEVTKYSDGTEMLAPAYKYYLFDEGKWIKDIYYDKVPMTFTWSIGIHKFQMEAEIKTNTGTLSSEKSPEQIIDVQEVVTLPPVIQPPKAPVIIDIPDEGVIINQPVLITPVQ